MSELETQQTEEQAQATEATEAAEQAEESGTGAQEGETVTESTTEVGGEHAEGAPTDVDSDTPEAVPPVI